RLTSYVSGASGEKNAAVLVAEVDVAGLGLKPQAGTVSAAFDTYVVLHGRDTGTIEKQEKLLELSVPEQYWPQVQQAGVAFRREFALPAGAYQARLLVRDKASGRLGTRSPEVRVAAPE